jgi:hypothetical protein
MSAGCLVAALGYQLGPELQELEEQLQRGFGPDDAWPWRVGLRDLGLGCPLAAVR